MSHSEQNDKNPLLGYNAEYGFYYYKMATTIAEKFVKIGEREKYVEAGIDPDRRNR
jgi:hypothetical protein